MRTPDLRFVAEESGGYRRVKATLTLVDDWPCDADVMEAVLADTVRVLGIQIQLREGGRYIAVPGCNNSYPTLYHFKITNKGELVIGSLEVSEEEPARTFLLGLAKQFKQSHERLAPVIRIVMDAAVRRAAAETAREARNAVAV